MKIHLMVTLHVAEQRWLDNYGTDGPADQDVVEYYTHEVIAGSYPAEAELLRITQTYLGHASKLAAEPAPGMAAVFMVVELDVDRAKWATFGSVDAGDRAQVTTDVAGYFQESVLEPSSPVSLGLVKVADVTAMSRAPRKRTT